LADEEKEESKSRHNQDVNDQWQWDSDNPKKKAGKKTRTEGRRSEKGAALRKHPEAS